MRLDHGGHDGQAQPGAAAVGPGRGADPADVGAGEPLEDPALQVLGNAGAGIDHGEHRHAVLGRDAGLHFGARRGVGTGIGQQVDHHLVQPMPITQGRHRMLRHIQPPPVIGPGHPGIADRIDHHFTEIGGLDVQIGTGVEPGQQQQVLDQMGHPVGLRLHPGHGVRGVGRQLVPPAAGQLGIAADGGQRVAQFVRRVGHELPDPGLTRLAGGQRLLDVVQHVVERLPDPADLRRGVGVGVWHPYGQCHLTTVEFQLGHLLRGSRDPVQRPQTADHHHPRGNNRTGYGQQGQQRLQADQLDQKSVHIRQGQTDDDGPVRPGHGDQPVAPQVADQSHRNGVPVARHRLELRDQRRVLVVGQRDVGPIAAEHSDAGRAAGRKLRHQRPEPLAGNAYAARGWAASAAASSAAAVLLLQGQHLLELSIQLTEQQLPGGQGGEQSEQDGGRGDQGDDPDQQLAAQSAPAEGSRLTARDSGRSRRGSDAQRHAEAGRNT